MIRLIDDKKDFDFKMLSKSLSGKKIIAYLNAYGTGYDFCRFYKIEDDEKYGYMFLINSTLIICSDYEIYLEELVHFIIMNEPFRVEGTNHIIKYLSDKLDYQILNRTIFELIPDKNVEIDIEENPKLEDVYGILTEGFPNISEFGLWYTDTSHRCRHNISKVYIYKGSTTASEVFDVDGEILIGQVATKVSARGSGYARILLKWLAQKYHKQNKRAYLLALDVRYSYYKEIGFKEIKREIVLERQDVSKDSVLKGKLANES